MHRYLSVDNICFANSFPRAKLEENYEEKIMSNDKYPSIFSPQNGGYCLYYPSNLSRNAHSFLKIEEY